MTLPKFNQNSSRRVDPNKKCQLTGGSGMIPHPKSSGKLLPKDQQFVFWSRAFPSERIANRSRGVANKHVSLNQREINEIGDKLTGTKLAFDHGKHARKAGGAARSYGHVRESVVGDDGQMYSMNVLDEDHRDQGNNMNYWLQKAIKAKAINKVSIRYDTDIDQNGKIVHRVVPELTMISPNNKPAHGTCDIWTDPRQMPPDVVGKFVNKLGKRMDGEQLAVLGLADAKGNADLSLPKPCSAEIGSDYGMNKLEPLVSMCSEFAPEDDDLKTHVTIESNDQTDALRRLIIALHEAREAEAELEGGGSTSASTTESEPAPASQPEDKKEPAKETPAESKDADGDTKMGESSEDEKKKEEAPKEKKKAPSAVPTREEILEMIKGAVTEVLSSKKDDTMEEKEKKKKEDAPAKDDSKGKEKVTPPPPASEEKPATMTSEQADTKTTPMETEPTPATTTEKPAAPPAETQKSAPPAEKPAEKPANDQSDEIAKLKAQLASLEKEKASLMTDAEESRKRRKEKTDVMNQFLVKEVFGEKAIKHRAKQIAAKAKKDGLTLSHEEIMKQAKADTAEERNLVTQMCQKGLADETVYKQVCSMYESHLATFEEMEEMRKNASASTEETKETPATKTVPQTCENTESKEDESKEDESKDEDMKEKSETKTKTVPQENNWDSSEGSMSGGSGAATVAGEHQWRPAKVHVVNLNQFNGYDYADHITKPARYNTIVSEFQAAAAEGVMSEAHAHDLIDTVHTSPAQRPMETASMYGHRIRMTQDMAAMMSGARGCGSMPDSWQGKVIPSLNQNFLPQPIDRSYDNAWDRKDNATMDQMINSIVKKAEQALRA